MALTGGRAEEPAVPTVDLAVPTVDLAVPAVALAIAAHPDDVELRCGATLAKWAAAGCAVHHLVLTDGSRGTWDPDADLGALVRTRQREQRDAAAALGATGRVVFGDAVDGELEATLARRAEVARWIRELRPEVVLGHDPWRRYRLHPDHRHAGWLTVDACVAARDPHFDVGGATLHHRPAHLLLFEADDENHVEDVAGFEDAKLAAVLAHRSQWRTTLGIDHDDDGTQRAALRDRLIGELARAAAPVAHARGEAFHRLEL